jgi:hypothetical protein
MIYNYKQWIKLDINFFLPLLSSVVFPLSSMSTPSLSIQALIAGTAALNCDDLSALETVPLNYPQQDSFCLIGRLLSPKPPSAYWVHEILTQVWKFACPFEVMDLPEEKYLFKLSQRSHMDKILDQGPWNVKGSLLILKTWSPELSFDEVELTFCPFWVQIHGLPRHNMTAKNAAQIGCLIGSLLDVEHGDIDGIICTHHLRVKVKVDSSKPLAPGFLLPRQGCSAVWVWFLYERLADYCVLCGLVGHRRNFCPAPPPQGPDDRYGVSLRAFVLSGSRSFLGPPLAIQASPVVSASPVALAPPLHSSSFAPISSRPVQNMPPSHVSYVDIYGPSVTPTKSYHVPRLNPYLPTLGSYRATSVSGLVASPVVPDRGKGLCSDFEFSGLNSLDPCFVSSSRALPDNQTFPISPAHQIYGPFSSLYFLPINYLG